MMPVDPGADLPPLPGSGALIEPADLDALVHAMAGHVSQTVVGANFSELHDRVRNNFSAQAMSEAIMQAYRDTLAS